MSARLLRCKSPKNPLSKCQGDCAVLCAWSSQSRDADDRGCISFFKFPAAGDPKRSQWETFTGRKNTLRPGALWRANDNSRVCHRHFSEAMKEVINERTGLVIKRTLLAGAPIPSLFPARISADQCFPRRKRNLSTVRNPSPKKRKFALRDPVAGTLEKLYSELLVEPESPLSSTDESFVQPLRQLDQQYFSIPDFALACCCLIGFFSISGALQI